MPDNFPMHLKLICRLEVQFVGQPAQRPAIANQP
jgi:hypothetical protein